MSRIILSDWHAMDSAMLVAESGYQRPATVTVELVELQALQQLMHAAKRFRSNPASDEARGTLLSALAHCDAVYGDTYIIPKHIKHKTRTIPTHAYNIAHRLYVALWQRREIVRGRHARTVH